MVNEVEIQYTINWVGLFQNNIPLQRGYNRFPPHTVSVVNANVCRSIGWRGVYVSCTSFLLRFPQLREQLQKRAT